MSLGIVMLLSYIPILFWIIPEVRGEKKPKHRNKYSDEHEQQTPWQDSEG